MPTLPIDRAHLSEISFGDTSFEIDLLAEFLRSVPGLIDEMKSGLGDGDTDRVHTATHTLKGSCRSLGAVGIATACEQLEQALRDRAQGEYERAVAEVEAQFVRARAFVTRHWTIPG